MTNEGFPNIVLTIVDSHDGNSTNLFYDVKIRKSNIKTYCKVILIPMSEQNQNRDFQGTGPLRSYPLVGLILRLRVFHRYGTVVHLVDVVSEH